MRFGEFDLGGVEGLVAFGGLLGMEGELNKCIGFVCVNMVSFKVIKRRRSPLSTPLLYGNSRS